MNTAVDRRLSSYQHGEGRTMLGQHVGFSCPSGEIEGVQTFLQENIRTIEIPTTGKVMAHGWYGRNTRYKIRQHDYAGGGPGEGGGWGYIEVLKIANPPDDREGIIIHEETSMSGSVFTEWMTLKHARAAFKKTWGSSRERAEISKLRGFKRRVVCGALTPWFYAIGDQQLIGDYAFPEGLQDDPVYRFGQKFVVYNDNGEPSVKTCMGTRFYHSKEIMRPYDEVTHRVVYWSDGSLWKDTLQENRQHRPRPLEDGELWIEEAVTQFRQMLTGKSTDFTINFTDGNKFVGKLVREQRKNPCVEGRYVLAVALKGKTEPLEGSVKFVPTREHPDVISYVTQKYQEKGMTVEYVKVLSQKTEVSGKKWAGAFFKSTFE